MDRAFEYLPYTSSRPYLYLFDEGNRFYGRQFLHTDWRWFPVMFQAHYMYCALYF